MRSIKMLSAFNARQRSSVRLVMRLYLIPASGLNSNVVTTGPGLICVIWPWTSNSAYFSVSTCASSFNSSASTECCSSGRWSRLLDGSLYPPAIRGIVVLALWSMSARCITAGSAAVSPSANSGRIPPVAAGSVTSGPSMRSMPVRRGSGATRAWTAGSAGLCRDGINCVFTTGFEFRRLSSSFCCRRLVRSSCQSW